MITNYVVLTVLAGATVKYLDANPLRRKLRMISGGGVVLGKSIADIAAGAGGMYLDTGLYTTPFVYETTDEVWIFNFGGDPVTIRGVETIGDIGHAV